MPHGSAPLSCPVPIRRDLAYYRDKEKKQHAYQVGDQVWLDGRNIKTYHPTTKLAPKHHGPFPIKRALSTITYQLTLPEQWKIHDVFHVDLLTPYRETEFHGPNYARPPPDLINEEEQYKVEQVLDERNYGRWKKKQYLVKWKGYPDSDNQWLDAKDMGNAQELIAEFHNSNSKLRSHIRSALRHLPVLHPLPSTLSSTLIPLPMSDAAHTETVARVEENTTPLPIPPRSTATNVPKGSVRTPEQDAAIQERIRGFLRICEDGSTNIAGIRFPHPDEPTPGELNDSDQENIPPTVVRPNPPVQAPPPLGRTRHLIQFTDDVATNQAILAAITRVRNTVDHGDTYVAQIEEIVRIGRALQHQGTPSEDEEAAALIAQLNQIRRLGSRSESSSSETSTPADVSFLTPSVLSYMQVSARTLTPSPRVHVMARGPAPSQQRTSRGQRGAGSQARRMGARVLAVPMGVRDGAELLPISAPRRAEMPPPIGFNYNRGPNYVPFIITNNQNRSVPARFTRVIMGADPHVIGMIPGDNNQYGGPLHAAPDHDQGERPLYAHDNL